MTGAANANFGTCGNDNGNDGGKWELTFASAFVVNPSVMVVVKNAVIAIVVVIGSVVVVVLVVSVDVINPAGVVYSSLPSLIVNVE